MGIIIEIDDRERSSGIKEVLCAREDIIIEERRLLIGDYLINKHIAVERKTVKDFILSLIDGRLFSQASRLRRYAEIQFMIIEGTDLFHTSYNIDPQAIKGAIVSLSVSWQIPLIFSKSSKGTAEVLIMAGDHDVRYRDDILKRVGKRPGRLQTRKLFFLQGLPNIGPKTAKKMLKHFGSIEKVIIASERELACVEGIGKRKAAMIRRIVQ